MLKNPEDRRARRTRRLLKESLLELMEQKHFSEISVRDVTDNADMNRTTFYLHYTDTTQLLQSMEEDLLAEVQRLRAENAYLKNLQALVLEDERHQRKKRR